MDILSAPRKKFYTEDTDSKHGRTKDRKNDFKLKIRLPPGGGERSSLASITALSRSRLRPEREGGARLADPPGALEISQLRVSPRFRGSGPIQRPSQNKCQPSGPPFLLAHREGLTRWPGADHTPRPAPCAADPGYRHSHAGIQMGQRTAEDSRGRRGSGGLGQGLWGETHHGSEEFAHTLSPHRSRP